MLFTSKVVISVVVLAAVVVVVVVDRRARRGLRRIPIAIPSVPIKLLFSAGTLGMRR